MFDAALREQIVVGAADALATSQRALSHAPRRLRHALKDHLLQRTAAMIGPTATTAA
ncbi:LysR family transcriptional regulator [Bradyrhizobium vignae]|uniref:LysR family transcriptional regulator n=1 Tax=Bradyrhizobium vignae TaxID=1549949 RepID=UPI003D31B950